MSAIDFEDVSIALGGRRILSGVSFSIEQGHFVGVLGPNGAGKTTLFRTILGLLTATSGKISVLGSPPARGNAAIGYIPQWRHTAAQLNFTGFELLLSAYAGNRWGLPIASQQDRKAVEAALERVGGRELAGRALTELSGGERQRLFIAQALVGEPKLLLFDEPLISLDPAHQRSIVELVRDISRERNIAVLFSAHEVNPLLGAVDEVLYLGQGKAAIGTVDEVVNERVLSALYDTRVHVIRTEGRIFVVAEGGEVDDHLHDHAVTGHATMQGR
ncbi:MAG: ABC transporter ATP-binding protein [Parvibaculum sp.]|uniref:metal ABC transporter ATP-binding protein n=1 Tax=Parvibaculum sp. TaxID=2024848 RepID=UPI00283B5049|nr:ABC transporter ATP-binding protein [Parvibaculum sp.]MDR3497631.1 ABC transporter ATP-binding protein [Parvibaculum sp.]